MIYFSYTDVNFKTHSNYRSYSKEVPSYLRNCPRDSVKHCNQKISTAMGADLTAINIVRQGFFSVKSFANNESERYIVDFGDDETMPKCTCQDWALSQYPCNHFFALFRKYIPWHWDALSPPCINSHFLKLNNLDDTAENNNNIEKSNKNKAEFTAGN